MPRIALLALVTTALTASPLTFAPPRTVTERHGADLGIGRGLDSHRPNILVAWRNSERILEVEILVRNLGDQPGRGHVRLEICDDEGRQLLATKPFDVLVPARDNGGEEGTVVQTKGFRMMNIMFDQLDRLGQRYKLRATVETEGGDLNPIDNVATKAFNVDSRALPGTMSSYRYRLANTTDSVQKGVVYLDHTAVPSDWVMTATPAVGTEVTLKPKEVFTGYVTVTTPKQVSDGEHIDLQAGLATGHEGALQVVDQDEWYLVATNQPPQVDPPAMTLHPDGSIAVNVAAFDPLCGIKEASGVQVAYSLDHGTTFSTRVMAYTRGNFYDKTWFESTLGPFAPGVEVTAVVTVQNNAGILRRFNMPPLKVPQATAAKADATKPEATKPAAKAATTKGTRGSR